jgi:hypothetical protein
MQKKLATAMGVFCANLGADIKLYIEPMMAKLVSMVRSGNVELADHAILAIHSVALAAKDDFVPFYEETVKIVGALMTLVQGPRLLFLRFFFCVARAAASRFSHSHFFFFLFFFFGFCETEKQLQLRAHATECVGAIALAVGRERFAPLLAQFVKLAFEGMAQETFDLRESTYHFFGFIAHTFGKDFVPALSAVVACIFATCRSDDGITVHTTKRAFDSAQNTTNNDPGDDVEAFQPEKMTARSIAALQCLPFFFPCFFESRDARYALYRLVYTLRTHVCVVCVCVCVVNGSIRTGALDEKSAALACMGTLMTTVGAGYLPFLEPSLAVLRQLATYPHPQVRAGVVACWDGHSLTHVVSKKESRIYKKSPTNFLPCAVLLSLGS